MRTGERLGSLPLSLGEDHPNTRKRYMGRVIYVHPQRRFFVAELELPGGHHIREAYHFKPPAAGRPMAGDKGKYRKDK